MIFKELSKDEYGKLLGIFMCNTEEHPNSELVKSGRFLKPHADNYKNVNQGNIAIGYGFDLKVNDIAQITKMYRGVFGDKWQLTQEETLVLKDYKNGKITTSAALSKFGSIQNLSLDLKTRDNAYKLYSLTLSAYEDKVNNNIPKSYERLALVSRAYNHYGSDLMKAVSQRDRFLIWFHLRYTINTQRGKELNGLTKRRLWESDIFDLVYKDDFEAVINIFSSLNIFKFNEQRMIKYIQAYEKRNFTEENISSFKKDATSRNLTGHFSFKYSKIKDVVAPFLNKFHSLIKEVTSTVFDLKNIYVVNLNSDGTNNISKINKALEERERDSEFKEESKEEILLILPYKSAQPIAPYQPKNTKLTIILADKTHLDCVNLNPSGKKEESKIILTNYKYNPYNTNKNDNIKFIVPSTSAEVTLYKDNTGKFVSQDGKYFFDNTNKLTLNFFNNLNFNLLNFAKENNFNLRNDKASSMFNIKLKLSDKEPSVSTTHKGNFDLTVSDLIITDENQNSTDIKKIYLHNGEDKKVYKSYYLEKNGSSDNEADKDSYTAKFNINLIQDKDQSAFKKTTKMILASRDLSKDHSTEEIHSMSDNGVISVEAKKKAEGSTTYDLKTSLVDIANNITNVVIENTGKLNVKEAIKLKAMYKPNKGDDNYKDINWAYEIIRQDEYNKEIKDNNPTGYIVLEGDKFKGKEISFTPQNDIKDKELLEKLKENNSTIVFFAYLRSPSYKTRYGKTHIRADFRVPMELKYENNKLYIYEFGHTDKSLSFDASLSNAFINEINDTKKTDNAKGRYYISSNINSQSISIYKDHKLKELAYCSINDRNKPARALLEIYASGDNTKSSISNFQNGINLINSENKSKFISKFNEVKQRVKLENTQSVGLEVIEEDNEIIFPLKVKPLNDKDGVHSRYYWASAPGAHQASFGSGRSGGKRRHAGRDLYTLANAEIVAIADGIVLNTSFFYCKTNQVTIMHYFKGRKIIIRYGELVNIPVKAGDRVKKGQFLGQTGKLLNDRNQHINVVSGYTIYMIHFEYYTDGNNTRDPLTVRDPNNKFKRRSDLSDPLEILRIGYGNSFKTKK